MQPTPHLRLFAANPTRKPNAAANSVDATVSGQAKRRHRIDNNDIDKNENETNYSIYFDIFRLRTSK